MNFNNFSLGVDYWVQFWGTPSFLSNRLSCLSSASVVPALFLSVLEARKSTLFLSNFILYTTLLKCCQRTTRNYFHFHFLLGVQCSWGTPSYSSNHLFSSCSCFIYSERKIQKIIQISPSYLSNCFFCFCFIYLGRNKQKLFNVHLLLPTCIRLYLRN